MNLRRGAFLRFHNIFQRQETSITTSHQAAVFSFCNHSSSCFLSCIQILACQTSQIFSNYLFWSGKKLLKKGSQTLCPVATCASFQYVTQASTEMNVLKNENNMVLKISIQKIKLLTSNVVVIWVYVVVVNPLTLLEKRSWLHHLHKF